MICPNCDIGIRLELEPTSPVYSQNHPTIKQYGFDIAHGFCPECRHLIVLLRHGAYFAHSFDDDGSRELTSISEEEILYPRKPTDKKPAKEIPEKHRKDFLEAHAVLSISPRASAALSRRILQTILRETYHIKARNLADEIEAFLKMPGIPSYLSKSVDAVRNVGNLAAHPIKNDRTGEIVEVEPGEAEWLLDVIESLFDFAFVQPALIEEKREQLNAKLAEAGKLPMK